MKNIRMVGMDYDKWLLPGEELLRHLDPTKLSFLTYVDMLSQDRIYDILQSVNSRYNFNVTPDWDLFTSGLKDLEVDDFKRYFLEGLQDNEQVLLFTDEGLNRHCLFVFKVCEFDQFSSWYEEFFNVCFFQFSDYTVIVPALGMIRFKHDEEGIHEFIILK